MPRLWLRSLLRKQKSPLRKLQKNLPLRKLQKNPQPKSPPQRNLQMKILLRDPRKKRKPTWCRAVIAAAR
jgi:hypothetical protein